MEAKGEQEVEKVIQREMKKRSKRACGCMTSVVFHLCVVDVLINSVRFSFWRLHGVFQDREEAHKQPQLCIKICQMQYHCFMRLFVELCKRRKTKFDCRGRKLVLTCKATNCTSEFTV